MVVVDRTLSIFDVLEVDVFLEKGCWCRKNKRARNSSSLLGAPSHCLRSLPPCRTVLSPYSLIPVARSARSFGIVLEISLPSICLLAISRA